MMSGPGVESVGPRLLCDVLSLLVTFKDLLISIPRWNIIMHNGGITSELDTSGG